MFAKVGAPVLTRRQVSDLARFRPTPYLVTTLYLDIDRSVPGGRGRSATLRTLTRDLRASLDDRNLTRKQRHSLEQDLAALERIARDAQVRDGRALCAFVASGAGYEQVFDLPHPVKSRVVADETPYVRPLAAALAEQPRYLVVLVDRSRARLLAAQLGRVREIVSLESDVPGQVKEGGYRGNAERGIERHIEEHVLRHLKKVAETVREVFGDRDYDFILLGGPAEVVAELGEQLNPSLRPHVAGEIAASVAASPEEVAAECRSVLARNLAHRDSELMGRLAEAVETGGAGVNGVLNTLGALRRGAVAALLVLPDFEQPGAECRGCGFLGLEGEAVCPACGQTGSRRVPDLVREMIDQATEGGAEVFHVGTEPAATRLRAMGGVGALLRFRLV